MRCYSILFLLTSVAAPAVAQSGPKPFVGARISQYQLGFGSASSGPQRVWMSGLRGGLWLPSGVGVAGVLERSFARNISVAPRITTLRGEVTLPVFRVAAGRVAAYLAGSGGAMYFDTRHVATVQLPGSSPLPPNWDLPVAGTGWRGVSSVGLAIATSPVAGLWITPGFDGVLLVGRGDAGPGEDLLWHWSLSVTWAPS